MDCIARARLVRSAKVLHIWQDDNSDAHCPTIAPLCGNAYLKRGVNDSGRRKRCGIEQIVEDSSRALAGLSSYVQVRGSIPAFWFQETSVAAETLIRYRHDPTFEATRKHFEDLLGRWGSCPRAESSPDV